MLIQSSALTFILHRYPQLGLKPIEGLKDTKEYSDIVRKGIHPEKPNDEYIVGSEADSLTVFETPVGKVEVLFIKNREDFCHFVRILAYKGEPRNIPDSMGAITIRGLINWKNFPVTRDTLILLSNGGYSGLKDIEQIKSVEPCVDSIDKWINVSRDIRTYHELTHVICRNKFLDNKEAIRDEVIADAIGVIKALGYYNTDLARLFLGIEGDSYREGGRLQNYVSENEDLVAISARANRIIRAIKDVVEDKSLDIFEYVEYLETKGIGIEKD